MKRLLFLYVIGLNLLGYSQEKLHSSGSVFEAARTRNLDWCQYPYLDLKQEPFLTNTASIPLH